LTGRIGAKAIATLKIDGKKFVVIPEREYQKLITVRSKTDRPKRAPESAGADAVEDAADVAIALRRMSDRRQKSIPWAEVKKLAGLT